MRFFGDPADRVLERLGWILYILLVPWWVRERRCSALRRWGRHELVQMGPTERGCVWCGFTLP